jgi:Gas vesicle synthesis protein GvpO
MAESKREEAQRRRAEGRRRRREQGDGEPERAETEQDDSKPEEPLEAVKHAAKVAAAAAAVGAAMGAARAITSDGHPEEPESQPEPAEPEEPEPRSEPAEQRPQPSAEQEQPAEQKKESPPTERDEHRPRERADDIRRAGASPQEARRVVASAREQLTALLEKEPDSVSGLDRNGDGWLVTLEVVELARIPESTDVLASYELELDRDGKLVRYRRGRRYYRSQADDGELT